MALVCPICRDGLARGEESKIVAGQCGHVFHLDCLNKWISQGSQGASYCPCCRTTITTSNIVSLYPTMCDQTSTESVQSFEDLSPIIKELSSSLKKIRGENKLKDEHLENLRNELKHLEQKYKKLDDSTKVWIKLCEKNDRYKSLHDNLVARNKSLENCLKRIKSAEKVLNFELPHTELEGRNECCIQNTLILKSENEILSKELQDTKTLFGKLQQKFDEIKILYEDASNELREFVGF